MSAACCGHVSSIGVVHTEGFSTVQKKKSKYNASEAL